MRACWTHYPRSAGCDSIPRCSNDCRTPSHTHNPPCIPAVLGRRPAPRPLPHLVNLRGHARPCRLVCTLYQCCRTSIRPHPQQTLTAGCGVAGDTGAGGAQGLALWQLGHRGAVALTIEGPCRGRRAEAKGQRRQTGRSASKRREGQEGGIALLISGRDEGSKAVQELL